MCEPSEMPSKRKGRACTGPRKVGGGPPPYIPPPRHVAASLSFHEEEEEREEVPVEEEEREDVPAQEGGRSTPPPPLCPEFGNAVRALSSLPSSLRELGQSNAWWSVHKHLVTVPRKPMVLWGGTGVGKSV